MAATKKRKTSSKKTEKVLKNVSKSTKKTLKKVGKTKLTIKTIFIILVLVLGFVFIVKPLVFKEETVQEVLSVSTLKEALKNSELNLYQVNYEGVAVKQDPKHPDKPFYYVAYKALVKYGINFDDVQLSTNDSARILYVDLPDIEMFDPIIDVPSLDLMLVQKVDEKNIVPEEVDLATKDVIEDCKNNPNIIEFARKNAESLITGFLKPFVDNLDEPYTIEFIGGRN